MSRLTTPGPHRDDHEPGATMEINTGSFRALTAQVAELTARVEQLDRDAFWVRTLEEMHLRYLGVLPDHGAQVRHLRSVSDDAS